MLVSPPAALAAGFDNASALAALSRFGDAFSEIPVVARLASEPEDSWVTAAKLAMGSSLAVAAGFFCTTLPGAEPFAYMARLAVDAKSDLAELARQGGVTWREWQNDEVGQSETDKGCGEHVMT